MQYIQVSIPINDISVQEMVIAALSNEGYEGFVEGENRLLAYINESDYKEKELESVLTNYGLSYAIETIAEQNWNTAWEENFEPVIVEGFCTVRADFHHIPVTTPFEIVITPKMSFGTGHHATTQLMMMQMKLLDFKDKNVFDFGTGTGILAILAEMLGAATVVAIDNDEWSYENAEENIGRNGSKNITIQQGSLEVVANKDFDIILANINRNILLQYMASLYGLLKVDGQLLMSGLLQNDREVIMTAATAVGFTFIQTEMLNNWIVLLFKKS